MPSKNPSDVLLDLTVFAPLGLVLGAREVVPELGVQYFGFCADRPPFSHELVRKAFCHAVDRELLVAQYPRAGLYRAASRGGAIPPAMPAHSHRVGLEYDLEKARALLDEAGYPGGKGLPEIRMVVPHWLQPLEPILELANPAQRISAYHDMPYALFRYNPEEEFTLRQQVTLLETRLSQKGKRIHRISLAECLDEAMRSQRPLEEWFAAEREQGVETIVETVHSVLAEYAPLVDLVVSYPVMPAVKALVAHLHGDDGYVRMRPPLTDLPAARRAALVAAYEAILAPQPDRQTA